MKLNNVAQYQDELGKVLNYVFDSEFEDFAENPSNIHVYYFAYLVMHGQESADEMLDEALTDLQLKGGV